MKRAILIPASLIAAIMTVYTARLAYQAMEVDTQERAWFCGYAQARCDWGHDAAFCASVGKTCDGLEWVTEDRIR